MNLVYSKYMLIGRSACLQPMLENNKLEVCGVRDSLSSFRNCKQKYSDCEQYSTTIQYCDSSD